MTALAIAWVVAPCFPSRAANAQEAPSTVIRGAGSASLVRAYRPEWANAMRAASRSVQLNYVGEGDATGRQTFARGAADFAVTGTPFTQEELNQFPGGEAGLVKVPLEATATTVVMTSPTPDGWRVITGYEENGDGPPCDPNAGYDPEAPEAPPCFPVTAPLQAKLAIPADNLGAMVLAPYPTDVGGAAITALAYWERPEILTAIGLPPGADLEGVDRNDGPSVAVRGDPSADNYYFQAYIKASAPDMWQRYISTERLYPFEPIREVIRSLNSQNGADQLANVLVDSPSLTWANQTLNNDLGRVNKAALLPPWGEQYTRARGLSAATPGNAFAAADPATVLQAVSVENGAGAYVAPSSVTITRAIELGGGRPIFGATAEDLAALDPAEAAQVYPLAWVNHLYAPRTGLSPDKTNALAGFIRYAVTAGQDVLVANNDGRLPRSFVEDALAKANELVESNCRGDDVGVYELPTPAPFAPNLPAVTAIGPVKYCIPTPWAQPSPTLTPTTTALEPTPTTLPARNPAESTTTTSTSASQAPASGGATGGGGGTTNFPSTNTPSSPTQTASAQTTSPSPLATLASSANAAAPSLPPLAPLSDTTSGDQEVDILPYEPTGEAELALPAPTATPPQPQALPGISLPFALPGDGKGSLDRASTLLLGAGTYWFGFRRFRRGDNPFDV